MYTMMQFLSTFLGLKARRVYYTQELIFYPAIVGRGFTNGPGDLGSIPDRVIPKTLKMVLDTSLLNTQQYKV